MPTSEIAIETVDVLRQTKTYIEKNENCQIRHVKNIKRPDTRALAAYSSRTLDIEQHDSRNYLPVKRKVSC